MKTSLILSTVLCALTLTPAAFANGAQEQTPAVAVAAARQTSVTVFTVQQLPDAASVTRSALQQLDVDVRANLVRSLRANSVLVVEALRIAAPAIVEAVSKPLELSSR
jgi:hypothetical protein